MLRLPRLAALSLLLALAGVSGTGLVLAGCDSTPATCTSGQIQSTDLAPGLGPTATDSSRVRMTYTAELEDGREVAAETNVTVNLATSSPPGFRQGVAGMRVNGRRRFVLPPNLGFGPEGGPAGIPSCARLTFTVELLEILPETCANNGSLVVEEIAAGTGDQASATSSVTISYTAQLTSGGTTVEQRFNFTFSLTDANVMPLGLRQGIVGMREGGERRLLIPPNLAFGIEGFPPLNIPSCARLTYEVELISVN
jgi:FKBP-type peptidyl-prolyl cis-trans isomerase